MTGICLFRQKMMLRQIFCSKTLKHWHSKVHFFASNESFDDFQVFLLISADPGDQWSLRASGRTTLNTPAPIQTLKFSKILRLECNTVVKRLPLTWNERSWVWIPPGFFSLLFILCHYLNGGFWNRSLEEVPRYLFSEQKMHVSPWR